MNRLIDKKIVFTFVISGILFISCGIYAASLYKAKDVSYNKENWEVNTVNEALDELKNKTDILMTGDATSADIVSGKTAVVNGEIITGEYITPSATVSSGNFGGSLTASKNGTVVISGSVTWLWGNSNSMSGHCYVYMSKNGTNIGSWTSDASQGFLSWHKKISVEAGDVIKMTWNYGWYNTNYNGALGNPTGVSMGGGTSYGTNVYTYSYTA